MESRRAGTTAWQAREEAKEMADTSTSSVQGEIDNAIRENAQGPESAEADGVKVKQHPLADQTRLRRGFGGQVAADKYLAGKDAVSRNPAKAFTRVNIVPPGSA